MTSFFTVVINKLTLLGYILSWVTMTRYTMYYHTNVANSDHYNAHYFAKNIIVDKLIDNYASSVVSVESISPGH